MTQRGFRYRFYPTPEQETLLRRTLGCVRLVYNRALHARSEAWVSAKKSIGYVAQSAALTAWKKLPELTFLNEVSSVPLQQSLRHLQTAYASFFAKRAAYPSFKRKSAGGSAEFTKSAFRFVDGALTLAKMTVPLNIRWSRPLPGDPSTVTVSLDAAGRWHVSLLVDDPTVAPLPPTDTAVGLDVGITSLVTLSTGEKIANPRFSKTELTRQRRLARSLSRKKKGSNNAYKARQKLAKHHVRLADRRQDHLHKLSTRLVRENQVIVVESLRVRNMVKNRRLSAAISDAAWSSLFRMLEYKSAWYGRTYIEVDQFFPSSKTCSCCGCRTKELKLSTRRWTCPKCRVKHDRDINAARNILAAGHAVNVCGPGVSQRILRKAVQSGMKQKVSGVS